MTGEETLLRPLEASDTDFLEQMTYEALKGSFKDIPPFGNPKVMETIALSSENWGRKVDTGLVVEDSNGEASGAAWYRLFPDRFTALGEGRSYTPVVTMAVRQEARGHGLGRALLEGLMSQAADDGVPRLNLSVALHNEAAKRLYDSVGFTEVKRYLAHFDTEFVPAVKMTARIPRSDE